MVLTPPEKFKFNLIELATIPSYLNPGYQDYQNTLIQIRKYPFIKLSLPNSWCWDYQKSFKAIGLATILSHLEPGYQDYQKTFSPN